MSVFKDYNNDIIVLLIFKIVFLIKHECLKCNYKSRTVLTVVRDVYFRKIYKVYYKINITDVMN